MKHTTIYGLLAKLEASYLAATVLAAATDGIQLAELPEISEEWAHDGARPAPPGTYGHQLRAAPSGRTLTLPVRIEPKGAGAAYSASVVPNIHTLMRAAGFGSALTSTAGAEKYVYTPLADLALASSLAAELYTRGEKFPFTGVFADWEISGEGPQIPLMTFTLRGLLGDGSDVAVPAITYPLAGILAPKAMGAAMFALNAVTTLKLRSWAMRGGIEITPRVDQNSAAGHAGFAMVRRQPTAEFTIETPLRTLLDPDLLWKNGTEMAYSVAVGAVKYNKHTWAGPKFQQSQAPGRSQDGNIALTTMTGQLNPSALGQNDELSVTFD